MLNAVGLQNISVDAFLNDKWPELQRLNVPTIISVAGFTEPELYDTDPSPYCFEFAETKIVVDEPLCETGLAPVKMPLQFNINIFASESANETLKMFVSGDIAAVRKCARNWPFHITAQCHQPFGKFWQFMPPNSRFAFFTAQMRARGDATNILVTGAILRQQRKNRTILHGQFDADNRAQTPR